METNYYIKDPCLMKNDNAYGKYGPVGVCGYLQDEYEFFKNVSWPDLSDIPLPEGNIAPVQSTYDNGDLLMITATNARNVMVKIFALTVVDSNRLIPAVKVDMEDMVGMDMSMVE